MSNTIEIMGKTLEYNAASELPAKVREIREETNARLMDGGVIIIAPETAFIASDAQIGAGTVILPNVVIEDRCVIGKNCVIGPFAYIRPRSVLGDGVKAGDFVEIKNSTIGDKTKMSHLTYVGDTDVGANVNFGCGTVTVNYDGKTKHRSKIGDGAFIGCNTNLVSPVEVGGGAYTAAGSTITEDVPPKTLAIARARQVIKTKWKDKRD